MKTVNDKTNLVKTLRKNPKTSVLFGDYEVKYFRESTTTLITEYLIYLNISDLSVDSIEILNPNISYGISS
tara:strand:- start:104 stop:316 length:213 start_codon:yes stop_codon:yes gene_type:complete